MVAIGASAGGLDACKRLLRALPADTGMAYILVQHLDPTHESMLVDLLSGHTAMTVRHAENGTRIEREHLYVIPPGYFLSVADGILQLSLPQERHGARLPFDFLMNSLAAACGARAICIVLSGTGSDGSVGLKAVHEKGGLVIAQEPDEADYDGMPRSAIMTGAVDIVLPLSEIPAALLKFGQQLAMGPGQADSSDIDSSGHWLQEIVNLLRTRTDHNFTYYKPGTLQRRIERRMAMAAAEGDMNRYLDLLRNDSAELDRLARDLLINVTSFFRDPQVFEFLASKTIPELVAGHAPGQPLRIWVAGCSTGEEAYSLAMLLQEEIAASRRDIRLQVFATDVDPEAIAQAREGLYPDTIAAEVSPDRLARFFTKEDHSYRVSQGLREAIVFTAQDILSDPPFSRLDFVSCRNLLIYLKPEAQAKIASLFHFALHMNGVLLLGESESIDGADSRFAVISKLHRVYRHVAQRQPGAIGLPMGPGDNIRPAIQPRPSAIVSRQTALAELCQRLVLENYAPAAVLISGRHECLYSLGPTDLYLRVAPGQPTQDLFAMARPNLRTKLRSAVQQAGQKNARIVVDGGRTDQGERFDIAVQPVLNEGEEFLLICFIDRPDKETTVARAAPEEETPRVAELERELKATRTELEGAIRNLEISNEEQRAINQETLSVSEEFQSTNEELLTSKEELQSLNEELTALNSQLQETLEAQRTTSNDLQNVLFSTDVATLFLDADFRIRFFTPATKTLFNLISSDIGRPLTDLSGPITSDTLLADARTVLQSATLVEREIVTANDVWYVIRVLPYRVQNGGVAGVVITFADNSERKRTAIELEAAKFRAESADAAKSRFLAAASHDLRQPLQTLVLLQGMLARTAEAPPAQQLIVRMEETLGAMSGMLNALLDINQIEAGTVEVEKRGFPIEEVLGRLRDEFSYHAQAKGLAFRAVPCSAIVHSDPRLLEQMLRNLLSNAIKYTGTGKVLLGCRRHATTVSIEVWDTGIGIPEAEFKSIFEEYRQLNNASRERGRGLGLGLSIAQRLGNLLEHPLHVRSLPSKGSTFSIDVDLSSAAPESSPQHSRGDVDTGPDDGAGRTQTILIVEDDPELRDLLALLLDSEGYRTLAAPDGVAAIGMPMHGADRPDLIVSDFNLPNGMNGLELVEKLRETLGRALPVIILTGDISTASLRAFARQDCLKLDKPVKPKDLMQTIRDLLATRHSGKSPDRAPVADGVDVPLIFVVDDDSHIRDVIRNLLEENGRTVEDYATAEAFLAAYRPGRPACLLVDANLPGMSGLDLLRRLVEEDHGMPTIMITGEGDVAIAVQAMKAGALDFIEKPIGSGELIASVERALDLSHNKVRQSEVQEQAAERISSLTPRQRQIMDLVLAGHPSKNIAADLGISQRTVENHRAAIMQKTETTSLPELARLEFIVNGPSSTPRARG